MLGHLVWEGDADIRLEGESLTFNNFTLTQPTYGPNGNFNSISSIDGDTNSLGIDFDAYSMSGWPAGLNSAPADIYLRAAGACRSPVIYIREVY